MASFEEVEQYQVLADGLATIMQDRIEAASPIESLAADTEKSLVVMQEANGEKFVARQFTPKGVNHIQEAGAHITNAWRGMYEACDEVGIEVARGHLIETTWEDYPYVAVNEYVEDAKPLGEVSVELKKRVASSLGQMLTGESPYMIGPEMLRADMFGVTSEADGATRALLLDTDPLIRLRPGGHMTRNATNVFYLEKFGELFWDHWCKPEERQAVFGELLKASISLVDESDSMEVLSAFSILQLMSNGVDTRAA